MIGLVIGVGLHHLIMNLAEMDDIMFGRTINSISYVISFVMTIGFNAIINLCMHKKLNNIQMVESLKAVEEPHSFVVLKSLQKEGKVN